MKIVTYTDNPSHEGYLKLKSSYPELITLPREDKYGNAKSDKIWAMFNYVNTLNDDDVVMFVDGHDVLIFTQQIDDLEEMAQLFDGRIFFNGEKACFPCPELSELFNQSEREGNRYLNSGVYMSKAKNLKHMLRLMVTMFGKMPAVDDQAAASVLYLASKLQIQLLQSHLMDCYSFIDERQYNYYPGVYYKTPTHVLDDERKSKVLSKEFPVIVCHANGKTDYTRPWMCMQTSVEWLKNNWEDTIEFHQRNRSNFEYFCTQNYLFYRIREWVKQNVWGFGEDVFAPMWHSLLSYLHAEFVRSNEADTLDLLEVGVFKGQALAMWASITDCYITAVSTFAPSGDVGFEFSEEDVYVLFDEFNLYRNSLNLIKGDSTDPKVVEKAREQYHMVYIDGGHEYDVCTSDLKNYAPMVRPGGLLVVDDCCNNTQVPNGWFGGIVTVTQAVEDYMRDNEEWEFLFSLVHIKVFRRK